MPNAIIPFLVLMAAFVVLVLSGIYIGVRSSRRPKHEIAQYEREIEKQIEEKDKRR